MSAASCIDALLDNLKKIDSNFHGLGHELEGLLNAFLNWRIVEIEIRTDAKGEGWIGIDENINIDKYIETGKAKLIGGAETKREARDKIRALAENSFDFLNTKSIPRELLLPKIKIYAAKSNFSKEYFCAIPKKIYKKDGFILFIGYDIETQL